MPSPFLLHMHQQLNIPKACGVFIDVKLKDMKAWKKIKSV